MNNRLDIKLAHPLEQMMFDIIKDQQSASKTRVNKLTFILNEIAKQRRLTFAVMQQFQSEMICIDTSEFFNPHIDSTNQYSKDTALIFAAKIGDKEGIDTLLLIGGANVNLTNAAGHTPLMEAAIHGHAACVFALLQTKGIAINAAQADTGDTALMLAIKANQVDCVRILAKVAELNVTNKENFNALTIAAKLGYESCLQVLLDVGASTGLKNIAPSVAATFVLNKQILHYAPALREAITNKHLACARRLLASGFDKEGQFSLINCIALEANELCEKSCYVFESSFTEYAQNHIDFSLYGTEDCAKNMLLIIATVLANGADKVDYYDHLNSFLAAVTDRLYDGDHEVLFCKAVLRFQVIRDLKAMKLKGQCNNYYHFIGEERRDLPYIPHLRCGIFL